MKKILRTILLHITLLLTLAGVEHGFAQSAFKVRAIEIQGLHRITLPTVKRYLPIKVGQTLKPKQTANILRTLYKTGFFEQVNLSRDGNTLIIQVIERPTIGQLKISGNSVIPTDKLKDVMKSVEITEGRVYNAATLQKIQQSLLNQYYLLGRYNARVDMRVTPMTRNRVAVVIDISEGLIAKVKGISIIGNHVFSESTLIKQMDLQPTGFLSFITQNDRYSEEKLESSVDKVRSYYMDRGYLKVKVKAAQAQVTPDRKSVFITIVVNEGLPYTVDKVDITGDLQLPHDEVQNEVKVKPGKLFSRQEVLDTQKGISQLYGRKGYLFASVSVLPTINDEKRLVSVVFAIKPGKHTYVRHITFSNNFRTNDVVLRREVQQLEAAPVSTLLLDESKRRMLGLPYIKESDYSIHPVPGVPDQVDVNYKVKEESSAQASIKFSYSDQYRFQIGAGLNQANFLGTGNTLGFNLSRNAYEQYIGIDYGNPYYTEDGISRSFNMSFSRVDPKGVGVKTGYTTNVYNLGVLYTIPIGQEQFAISRLLAGVSYQNLLLNLLSRRDLSYQIASPGPGTPLILPLPRVPGFVTENGRHYQFADFKVGLSRDSRDRAIFPTSGSYQSMFVDIYVPLDKKSVAFYIFNYAARAYQPIWGDFILFEKANLGYGNGFHGPHSFPFFKNFFAGGMETVRGYGDFTLGPEDSLGHPYGGNILVAGSLNLAFPNFISDHLRTSFFLDAGNVYTSFDNKEDFGGRSTNTRGLRYSTGLQLDWLTPFGPISISLGFPLNLKSGDKRDPIQFSLNSNF